MKEFTVTRKEAGQRMDKYIFKILDRAPKSFVYKMIRKKNIVLNDKKAGGQEVLKENDRIRIYFSDETFDKFASALTDTKQSGDAVLSDGSSVRENEMKLKDSGHLKPDIVYEDEDILIINKPAGLLSQKASPADYSANEMIIDYLLESGQLTAVDLRTFHPSVCNRLDRNTSGLLIAGKTIRGLQDMANLLKDRTVKKYYRALVLGSVTEPKYLTGYLTKDHQKNQVRITSRKTEKDSDFIETSYRPICHYGNATLLEVHLITGRSHQIRAHLASIGHPILGDTKYGNTAMNQRLQSAAGVRRQLLHAYRIEFPDGKTVIAGEPDAFQKAEAWMEHKNRESME